MFSLNLNYFSIIVSINLIIRGAFYRSFTVCPNTFPATWVVRPDCQVSDQIILPDKLLVDFLGNKRIGTCLKIVVWNALNTGQDFNKRSKNAQSSAQIRYSKTHKTFKYCIDLTICYQWKRLVLLVMTIFQVYWSNIKGFVRSWNVGNFELTMMNYLDPFDKTSPWRNL